MPRFSANLGFLWADLPLLDRIAAAAGAGFKAVELHYPYDHDARLVREACEKASVALLGINTAMGSKPEDRGLAAVPGREAEAREKIDQAFDFASTAGGTGVHVMAGVVPPERRQEGRATLIEALGYAAKRAADADLVVLLEPINQRDMPGYFYSSVEDALSIMDEVGSERVKLMFDCYHVGVSQGDVLTRLRKNFARIGHIQIAAVPSRAEPDEGELNYPVIFREIDALGWSGWVGAEYRPRAGTDAGLVWMERLGVTPGR